MRVGLLRLARGVGASAEADEGGGEDGKSEKGGGDCVIHGVFLLARTEAALMPKVLGLSVMIISVGGFEI